MTSLPSFQLDGQIAIVTGGGKGIGRGIALCLAEAGADVVVAARTESDLLSVVAEIQARGQRGLGVVTDVTDAGQVTNLAKRCQEEIGTPTIWVNNAGGLPDATPRYLTKTPEDRWDAQIDLNLKAVYLGATAAARIMEPGACIVNISSRSAFGPQKKNAPYAASKAATNSLTQSLAAELAPSIRVNAIAPGPVSTQNFHESTGMTAEQVAANTGAMGVPMGRIGTPEDIGAAVVFMASPAASWITGQCLYVDGGI
jgi:NAD(P)-dependent dehydrogenase (short-subunit alcohol dehydrogenase family)